MTEIPLRALGGNVLLRKVKQDGTILTLEGFDHRVLQLAEVVGLGGRWTEDKPWSPPMPMHDKHRNGIMDDGTLDPNWRPPDLSGAPRRPCPVFTPMHAERLRDLKVGDLVVYISSRVYDHFRWESFDILVYPGNWIVALVEDSHLTRERRRYERQAV